MIEVAKMPLPPNVAAERLTMCLVEAGFPQAKGAVEPCKVCGRDHAIVRTPFPASDDVKAAVARAGQLVFGFPTSIWPRNLRVEGPADTCACVKRYEYEAVA